MQPPYPILYEDNHLLAAYKPAGELVQGDKTGDRSMTTVLMEYVKKKYNKPGNVFLNSVHRLDRPVSGVVLFARTSKALSRMNELFQNREVSKTYLAVVKNRPKMEEDTLTHFLIKDHNTNKVKGYDSAKKGGKISELSYELVASNEGHHLLKVYPKTGRSHQIRVQLSKIGCPIVGDLKYGFNNPNPDKSICLLSHGLEFIHPVKKEPIKIVAGLPTSVPWRWFKQFA